MSENGGQSPPPHGGWWFGWLLAVLLLPPLAARLAFSGGTFFRILSVVLGCTAAVLHFISCVCLAPKGGCLALFLFLGGYALLAAAVLIGCAMNVPY